MIYQDELAFCTTEDDLKKRYRELCKKYHPDKKGGSKEAFQALQRDFEKTFNNVKGIHRKKDGTTYHKASKETAEQFLHIINELLKLKGLTIEVLGSFLWIGGTTKKYADILKKLGLKYSSSKKMWYKAPEGYHRTGGGVWDIKKIRSRYKSNYDSTTKENNTTPVLSY